jgi:hypothetical protein
MAQTGDCLPLTCQHRRACQETSRFRAIFGAGARLEMKANQNIHARDLAPRRNRSGKNGQAILRPLISDDRVTPGSPAADYAEADQFSTTLLHFSGAVRVRTRPSGQ